MYLQKHLVLVALSISLLCQIRVAEGVSRRFKDDNFVYFFDIITLRSTPQYGPISSLVLAQYAARAYEDMINYPEEPIPAIMTALW